jgi:sugar (pentulose or hexulose) kinase
LRHVAVIDIGKTNAKLLLVDLQSGSEVTIARRSNNTCGGDPYPHFDIDGLWQFLLNALKDIGRSQPVDALSITTHGAAAALVDSAGALTLPMLDYEHAGPDETASAYQALRPAFSETGAPRLPGGLNLGAQLFWQAQKFPDAFARTQHILTYPQFWAFRLTGVAASEATSLGCHTDLWRPFEGTFSSLVAATGWQQLFPPLRPASAVLGHLLPEIAAATGLSATLPVLCGIHDSNATLVPWLGQSGPRAVLSSGTWMIAMALGGARVALDEGRDVLVNVDARGEPVPTARFMAGREFDMITEGRASGVSADAETAVLSRRVMALPSLHPATGPFPGQDFAWVPTEPKDDAERVAAASFYIALMGAACLDLIGAASEVVVEGPLARNLAFARMLATAAGRSVLLAGQGAGTGLGAAMLAGPVQVPRKPSVRILPQTGAFWGEYVHRWREIVAARQKSRQAM